MTWIFLTALATATTPMWDLAAARNDELVERLEAHLDGRPPEPALASLHHRLGEARLTQWRQHLWDEDCWTQQCIDQWEQADAAPALAFATVLLDDPGYERMDEVLWALATETHLPRSLRAELAASLLEIDPSSPLAAEANVHLGEAALDWGPAYDPRRALAHFEAAAEIGLPENLSWFVRYKRGWCLYLVGQNDAALEEMEALVRDMVTTGGEPYRTWFAEDVLKELTEMLFFSGQQEEVVPLVLSLHPDPRAQKRFLDRFARTLRDLGSEAEQAAFAGQRAANGV